MDHRPLTSISDPRVAVWGESHLWDLLFASTAAASITGGRCWQAVIASITHLTLGSSPAHIICLKWAPAAAVNASHVTKQMHTLAVMLRLRRLRGGEAEGGRWKSKHSGSEVMMNTWNTDMKTLHRDSGPNRQRARGRWWRGTTEELRSHVPDTGGFIQFGQLISPVVNSGFSLFSHLNLTQTFSVVKVFCLTAS